MMSQKLKKAKSYHIYMVCLVYLHYKIHHKSPYNVRFGPGKVLKKSLVLIHQNLWEPWSLYINALRCNDAYLHQKSGSSLVLCHAKPLPKPMLTICHFLSFVLLYNVYFFILTLKTVSDKISWLWFAFHLVAWILVYWITWIYCIASGLELNI